MYFSIISTIIHHLWLYEDANNLIVAAAQQETVASTTHASLLGLPIIFGFFWLAN
jgi:hypothetical protein